MQSTAQQTPQRVARLGLFALGVCLAGAIDSAHAWQHNRVRVNVSVQMSVTSEQVPGPSYPWWAYFPYDPHLAAPAAPRYPHWPTSFPTNQAAQPAPSANVVWQPGAGVPGRLTSHQPAAPAPFSFDR
jgi:hypothetical protein